MSSRMATGFDLLSPVYDLMARLAIGQDIVRSQLWPLKYLKDCQRILIIGGGTGWILQAIRQQCPQADIDYIDISSSMISKAKERVSDDDKIRFITGTEASIPGKDYDVVITNFYLDMFSQEHLSWIIKQIQTTTRERSFWLVTDFVNGSRLHSFKLWIMYRFFRLVTQIEARRLPDWHELFIQVANMHLVASKSFSSGFIKSIVYQQKR